MVMGIVAQPPWTRLGKSIESACRKALFDFELLARGSVLSVALSGGKDSLTLLYMLKAILGHGFPKLPMYAIYICGEFSCGASIDPNFLEGICRTLNIPLVVKNLERTWKKGGCYGCSRERRSLIFEAAREVGSDVVAFAHHRDDSNQALLLNLLHKGEFAANLPKLFMYRYGVTIIRPLIYVAERMIYEFAKFHGFARRVCRCPVGQGSKRKEVKGLIERLESAFPNTSANLARAALKYGSQKAKKI